MIRFTICSEDSYSTVMTNLLKRYEEVNGVYKEVVVSLNKIDEQLSILCLTWPSGIEEYLMLCFTDDDLDIVPAYKDDDGFIRMQLDPDRFAYIAKIFDFVGEVLIGMTTENYRSHDFPSYPLIN